MAYGGKILKNNGKLFISPDFTPYVFQKRADFTVNRSYTLNTGTTGDTLIFVHLPNVDPARASNEYLSMNKKNENTYLFESAGAIALQCYIFSRNVPTPPKWGMAVYNSAGAMAFHSNCRPLQVEFKAYSMPSFTIPGRGGVDKDVGRVNLAVGFKVAAAMSVNGLHVFSDPDEGELDFDPLFSVGAKTNLVSVQSPTSNPQVGRSITGQEGKIPYINASLYD